MQTNQWNEEVEIEDKGTIIVILPNLHIVVLLSVPWSSLLERPINVICDDLTILGMEISEPLL